MRQSWHFVETGVHLTIKTLLHLDLTLDLAGVDHGHVGVALDVFDAVVRVLVEPLRVLALEVLVHLLRHEAVPVVAVAVAADDLLREVAVLVVVVVEVIVVAELVAGAPVPALPVLRAVVGIREGDGGVLRLLLARAGLVDFLDRLD